MITDGDSQEFTSLDESIYVFFKSAIRDRCGQHLVAKTYEIIGPKEGLLVHHEFGKALCLEIKRWVRSWINGTCCIEESQFEFSKKMLLHILISDVVLLENIGKSAIDILLNWINTSVLVHEKKCAFYRKKLILHFHEYVTNACEGMNTAMKKSSICAKPSHNMDRAAAAMGNYQQIKDIDKQHERWNQFMKTPLYFKHGSIHEISGLKKFVLVAQHILKNQYMGKLYL